MESQLLIQFGRTWNIRHGVYPVASGLFDELLMQNTGRQMLLESDHKLPLVRVEFGLPVLPHVPYRSANTTVVARPSANTLARWFFPCSRSSVEPPAVFPKM